MSALDNLLAMFGLRSRPSTALPGDNTDNGYPSSEVGRRPTPESTVSRIYTDMTVDPSLRAAILDLRRMVRVDGRVKKITGRTVRAAIKGGLRLETSGRAGRLIRLWDDFIRRTGLDNPQKLESDMRGLFLEGNLPLQNVVTAERPRVARLVRMPTETIKPRVGANGTFEDVSRAFDQVDPYSNKVIATFALWQLILARLTPDNFDDWGSFGRPYLDASRTVWQQLVMTEEDLVIRRRTRAPLRMLHVMEGASDGELEKYRADVERDQEAGNWRDFYMNKKGSVTAVQGDARLNEIADVVHLLDTFSSGAPVPKGLFGYAGDLNRDILDDLKRDFFDELDAMQDVASFAYELGFRMDLLLQGLNPDGYEYSVQFAERRTETLNQAADRALKYQALGVSQETAWRAAGLDPARERKAIEDEGERFNPYPSESGTGTPRVSVTPGNRPKGESATSITTRS